MTTTENLQILIDELKSWADDDEYEFGFVEGPSCVQISFGTAHIEISLITSDGVWGAWVQFPATTFKTTTYKTAHLCDWVYATLMDHEYWV